MTRRKKNDSDYFDNKRAYELISTWDRREPIPTELVEMAMVLINRLSYRPNFINYSWLDEMKSDAIMCVIKYLHNFNNEKYENVHAYITQIAWRAFISRITYEKKFTDFNKETLDDYFDDEQYDGEFDNINYDNPESLLIALETMNNDSDIESLITESYQADFEDIKSRYKRQVHSMPRYAIEKVNNRIEDTLTMRDELNDQFGVDGSSSILADFKYDVPKVNKKVVPINKWAGMPWTHGTVTKSPKQVFGWMLFDVLKEIWLDSGEVPAHKFDNIVFELTNHRICTSGFINHFNNNDFMEKWKLWKENWTEEEHRLLDEYSKFVL